MSYIKEALKNNSWTPNKDKQKTDHWEECPRCGSNRVQKTGFWFMFFLGFVILGISFWLLIIPPIGILGIVFGVIIMIASPFGAKQLHCKDCKKTWKPSKKEQSA